MASGGAQRCAHETGQRARVPVIAWTTTAPACSAFAAAGWEKASSRGTEGCVHEAGQHAQVPFIAWTADIPFAGKGVQRALAAAAVPFASYVMATTGEQFFLQDGSDEDGRPPLLVCVTARLL